MRRSGGSGHAAIRWFGTSPASSPADRILGPTLGGTVQTVIAGQGPGLPFIGVGFLPSTPFCGACTIGHSWSVVAPGSSFLVQVPSEPALLGASVAIQSAGLLTPGGCAAPQFSLTDAVVRTIL